mmetsp:Transcript_16643/g.28168  ORF Transcript_16643/g.28168 Transcript_16643/m.28168 type:complete len:226 (-) Transcript_16643:529-1206(-)
MDDSFNLSGSQATGSGGGGGGGYALNDGLIALNTAWCTETNAPDILPFRTEIVEDIKAQLKDQQATIDDKVEEGIEQEYFIISLYQMDIERVRYSLARYLRTRLLKIERNLEYILSNIDIMDRLSTEEKTFASKLNNQNNGYFEDNVTNRLVQEKARTIYDTAENRLRNAQPVAKQFVFCRAHTMDLTDLMVSSDQVSSLAQGDIGILHYNVIKDFVADGQAELL